MQASGCRRPRCHRLFKAVRPEALRPRLSTGLPFSERYHNSTHAPEHDVLLCVCTQTEPAAHVRRRMLLQIDVTVQGKPARWFAQLSADSATRCARLSTLGDT